MENTYETGLRLWLEWTKMWNGETDRALVLVADAFTLHLPTPAPTDARLITTPAAVKAWVEGFRNTLERLTFTYGLGPFVDVNAGVVAGPWVAETVGKGMGWACGMDTIRFVDGKIVEYWTVSREADGPGLWSRAA